MEIQLAEKLGVSRTPIREAIRKLELEGLVLMIPRKGAEVARISEKSMRDVLEVRRSLEELAIELACERMTEEDFKELDLAQNAFKKAVAGELPWRSRRQTRPTTILFTTVQETQGWCRS